MTFDKVKSVIVDTLNLDEEDITMEASLMDDLEIDSLDVVELIMALEEEFGLKIANEEAAELKTVGAIVEYIDAKLA
ncbi:MAG: acyl carrier protein [Lachnospiraceae bacterium]|nr:acyl carrier protein [Lachnospiraceae bacterium]